MKHSYEFDTLPSERGLPLHLKARNEMYDMIDTVATFLYHSSHHHVSENHWMNRPGAFPPMQNPERIALLRHLRSNDLQNPSHAQKEFLSAGSERWDNPRWFSKAGPDGFCHSLQHTPEAERRRWNPEEDSDV